MILDTLKHHKWRIGKSAAALGSKNKRQHMEPAIKILSAQEERIEQRGDESLTSIEAWTKRPA